MGLFDAFGGALAASSATGPAATPDLAQLFQTIDNAGENQRSLIAALPANLQQQYQAYKDANATAGTNLQTGVSTIGQALQDKTAANYDPNAPAVRAAEDAAKTSAYAEVPGQQDAIREALAATGGFGRGTAATQLAAPVLKAGQQVNQAILGTTASQLQAKQAASQKALETVTTMNDDTLQKLFGMNKEQAAAILNGNRQDLKDQLTNLITQSNNQTGQLLGVQGANITNEYNHSVAENAKTNAANNAWINFGTKGMDSVTSPSGFLSGLGGGGE